MAAMQEPDSRQTQSLKHASSLETHKGEQLDAIDPAADQRNVLCDKGSHGWCLVSGPSIELLDLLVEVQAITTDAVE